MARISQAQLLMGLVMFLYCTPSAFLIAPLAETASYDSALAVIAAAAIGIIVGFMAIAVARKQPEQFFAASGGHIIGKWLHMPLMAIFIFYLLHRAAMVLRNIQDYLVINHLPDTPNWAVAALLGLCVALTVRSDLETIFGLLQLLCLASGVVVIVFIPLSLGIELNTQLLFAFFTNHEWFRLAAGTIEAAPLFSDVFIILFLYPILKQPEKTSRSIIWATIIAAGSILFYLVPTIMAFGPRLTGELMYPVLEFIRSMRIADFIETLDPFMTIIWLPVILVKISLFVYAAAHSLAQLLKLKDTKPLSFSLTAITTGLSIHMAKNSTELLYFMQHSWPRFALLVQCLPLVYWLVWRFSPKKL